MSIQQAKSAAFLLQQELLELNADDVQLKVEELKLPRAGDGEIEALSTVSLVITYQDSTAVFYVGADGTTWGLSNAWGAVFNGIEAWKFDGLAERISKQLPALRLDFKSKSVLLAKLARKRF